MRGLFKWFLLEARDWAFAVVGIGGVILLPTFGGSWLLALPLLVIFVALYVAACFATSRWLGEGSEPETGA